MVKRAILATVAACALAVGIQAQEGATLVLRSGEKVSGQLVDMDGSGFTVQVAGNSRQIRTGDVAVIDFNGSGDLSPDDWNKVGGGQAVLLRNGQAVTGQLHDIGGTAPLRITFKTGSGERTFSSSEVGRIVLARPSGGSVGTGGGTGATPGVPEGQGIAVPGTSAWTPSGVVVRQGEVMRFATTGEVRLSSDANDIAGSAGARSQRMAPGAPLPRNFVGALIGRVANGEPFPIGDQTSVTMPAGGQLFLGINDDHLADNAGGFRVNIQRGASRR
jgi:hypothetical protein